MSRFFPHTPYAEDQPLAHVILATHALTRAVTAGTVVGMALAGVRHSVPWLRRGGGGGGPGPLLPEKLLLSSARGILAAVGITGVGLAARMWGRERVEWQDRSWRLLENRGQVETDDWTYAGMGAAAVATVAMRGRGKGGAAAAAGPARLGWRGVMGAVGMGSVGGLVGYLAWRYGVNGGKFVEKDNKGERKGM